jgi:hypothetical protein
LNPLSKSKSEKVNWSFQQQEVRGLFCEMILVQVLRKLYRRIRRNSCQPHNNHERANERTNERFKSSSEGFEVQILKSKICLLTSPSHFEGIRIVISDE